MRTRLRTWWEARSSREHTLLRLAATACALALAFSIGTGVMQNLAATRARIESQERDLTAVRRLARELVQRRTTAARADDRPLVTRIEATASSVVGHERIASMTPMVGAEEGVALRLVGASLGEVVRVLYGVEQAGDRIDTVDLVKHPDDPSRFDVTLEIARGGTS
jgi:hypothetical protein